jgi:hybrid cluster-associated redox disulfide protein
MKRFKYINLDDNIAKVLERYPESAPVFLSYGLHCVGCFANAFDTVGAGCQIHGMGDKEVSALLKDVNYMVQENEKSKK